MTTSSLKEFAELVPVCEQTSRLATVLEIFRSSGCDTIVVLSEQQHPLGVITLRQVMPHLMALARIEDTPVALVTGDLHKPVSYLEPSIVDPLTILPAQLSLSQFWVYLHKGIGTEDAGTPRHGDVRNSPKVLTSSMSSVEHLALVEDDGTFLGLVNSWRLLESEAAKFIAADATDGGEELHSAGLKPLVQLLEQLPLPLSLQTATGQVLVENLTWRQQIGTSLSLDGGRRMTPNALDASPVETRLGQLPVELGTGNYENLDGDSAPSQNLGIEPGKDAARIANANGQKNGNSARVSPQTVPEKLAVATLGVSAERSSLGSTPTASKEPAVAALKASATQVRTHSSAVPEEPIKPLAYPATQALMRSLPVGNVPTQQCKSSERAAIQRYYSLDTPQTAATDSPSQVSLSTLSAIKTQEAVAAGVASASVPELQKPSQERVFSFVKIPLPLSVVPQASQRVGQGEFSQSMSVSPHHRVPASSSPHRPSDLCLVLAQDTTEQQQVAKELTAKNADLIQLNRLKDEFLACISHELKTPLTAILGLSSLLKDQTLGKLNDRQVRYARLIYHSGRQLMTVVNDILDLTRMETGQLELTLEPVPIQSVCDRAYSQALQRPSEKDQQDDESTLDIPFTLEIEPGLDILIADELRLRQMLVHLLSNALKFTDASGEIGLRVNRWEGWIAFTVWDTGIGIPEEKQHLIFQKFQQLENPLTRRFEGAGLGLVLTQRLAHLHGGDVSFISKGGKGSQFTIVLPPCPPQARKPTLTAEPSQNPVEPSTLQPATQSSRNRLVLIVETVPRYLEDLTEQLKHLGYHAVVARSGTEAIEKARSLQPCTILLNPLLPQLSGWDVLTLLKSDVQTLHIPVLVTATQADKQHAHFNKADGFLSLPVQEQALLQSLTALGKPRSKTHKGLTILYLTPELVKMSSDSSVVSSDLTNVLSLQLSELNYRVLEADDLEQAELLAHVWNPDVVLLDSSGIADPFDYLQQFSLHPGLTALPLITLDRQTSEAANQINGLAVYPCLIADNQQRMASLLQVIQVAVGISYQPSILVMDVGEPGNRWHGSREALAERLYEVDGSQPLNVESDEPNVGSTLLSKQSSNLQPYTPWLQALIQYLQTAGFRSLLSCSWIEVQHQLQAGSVDLLLIRLTDISDASALVNGLISLAKLPNRPPILALDHRLPSLSPDQAIANEAGSMSELDLLLNALTTQFLHESSHSMSQLLDQINQILQRKD